MRQTSRALTVLIALAVLGTASVAVPEARPPGVPDRVRELRRKFARRTAEARRLVDLAEKAIRSGRTDDARVAIARLGVALESQRELRRQLEAALRSPPVAAPPELDVDLDRKVTLRLDGVTLGEARPMLAEQAGVEVVLGKGVDGGVRLRLDVADLKLRAALDLVAAQCDLLWAARGGRVVLSTR